MKVLVIFTYPNHTSLNYSFLQKTLSGLKRNKNVSEVCVLDLYEENFNPVLVFNEEKKRRDMYKDPALEKYRAQILWADQLVFIYPIWWGRPPAMLFGYIDQLFAANFAYKNTGGIFPGGLLKNKTAICISTMMGPSFYPLLYLNDAPKILMRRALLKYVGFSKVKFFQFGSMESKNGKQKEKLHKIEQFFTNYDPSRMGKSLFFNRKNVQK